MCFKITNAYLENNEEFGVVCLGGFWSKEDRALFKNN